MRVLRPCLVADRKRILRAKCERPECTRGEVTGTPPRTLSRTPIEIRQARGSTAGMDKGDTLPQKAERPSDHTRFVLLQNFPTDGPPYQSSAPYTRSTLSLRKWRIALVTASGYST